MDHAQPDQNSENSPQPGHLTQPGLPTAQSVTPNTGELTAVQSQAGEQQLPPVNQVNAQQVSQPGSGNTQGEEGSGLGQYRKLFINISIASLVGAALIAVVAVLIGDFNEVLARALATLALVAFHSFASLTYAEKSDEHLEGRGAKFFNNTVFTLIVLSFLTSIFGVWELFSGEFVGKAYGTYFVFLFASLHGTMLLRTTGHEKKIDALVYANYGFMGLVVAMLLPLIWWAEALMDILPDYYFRLLAAAGIVDATLTVLVVILYRVYLKDHPEVASTLFESKTVTDENGNVVKIEGGRRRSVLLTIIGIYLGIQIILSIIFSIISSLNW